MNIRYIFFMDDIMLTAENVKGFLKLVNKFSTVCKTRKGRVKVT